MAEPVLYWAWPPDGSGHAAQAAAICRHVKRDVVVVRGSGVPFTNRALDYHNIPYTVIDNQRDALKFMFDHQHSPIVLDGTAGKLHEIASLYLWRLGRIERLHRPVRTIRVEGPGSLWPTLLLENDDILSREEARDELGINQDEHVSMGIASQARPGVIENHPSVTHMFPADLFPALKWLRAADHIVGCPGQNLYGEVAHLGLPVTWVKAPNSPDQAVRIRTEPWTLYPDASRVVAGIIDRL